MNGFQVVNNVIVIYIYILTLRIQICVITLVSQINMKITQFRMQLDILYEKKKYREKLLI